MNAPQANAVEANLTNAGVMQPEQKGAHHAHAWCRNNGLDADWMEADQSDAELEFLVAEMASKNRREYRRSLNY